MKHVCGKFTITILVLLAAISLIVMSTYAWMTLSASPAVEGLQVTIGGSRTILLAPDVTSVGDDGTVYHYPGTFSDKLSLSQLLDTQTLSGLVPVSTADGLHWYLPAYYAADDQAVKNHLAAVGKLKDISAFTLDDSLAHANLTGGTEAEQGSYLYVDFWVASPDRYDLRVSTANESDLGSYLIGLQEAVSTGTGTYQLVDDACPAAESVRVGFLVNQDTVEAETLLAYQHSSAHNGQFSSLRGMYQEKGQALDDFAYPLNSFSIYEPNGDSHSALPALEGSYAVTEPVGYSGGAQCVNVGDRVSVQLRNTWLSTANDVFQASIVQAENHGAGTDEAALCDYFYQEYLAGQVSTYVHKGQFIENTPDIYSGSTYQTGIGYVTDSQTLASLTQGGASTSHRIVALEQNIPQRIRMFIWLEGQDIDCAGGVKADHFAMSIELAGSSPG